MINGQCLMIDERGPLICYDGIILKSGGKLRSRPGRERAKTRGKKEKNSFPLDPQDRAILNAIQRNFPVTHRPFLALGRRLGMKEKEVLDRVRKMKEAGIIRRIGASFSAGAVGFRSTLCAAKVPSEKIEDFVAVVNAYPGVTHNYERGGDYNIWFTLIAPSRKRIEEALAEISLRTGVKKILNLPATKTVKIAVDFNFE
jgi:DNA-binding Lrp family transcriptional regulator